MNNELEDRLRNIPDLLDVPRDTAEFRTPFSEQNHKNKRNVQANIWVNQQVLNERKNIAPGQKVPLFRQIVDIQFKKKKSFDMSPAGKENNLNASNEYLLARDSKNQGN
jgi:hypothetical protein